MNDNQITKIINTCMKEAMKHQSSSPETKTAINDLKISMVSMKKDIEQINSKLDDLGCFIKTADKKYASKEQSEKEIKSIKSDFHEELGTMKRTIEKLKAFRWQIMAGLAVALWALETFGDRIF